MGIVTVLQSKKFVTAEHIAVKYSISVRTVYRDIRALTEIGVPVSFENGRGYFIVQGYFLPPVSFSKEEANALILMSAVTQRFSDVSIKKHYESALNKVTAVMRGSEKDKAEQLQEQIKKLNRQLEDERIKAALYKKMIEIAERDLGIPIEKKYGAKRSTNTGSRKK